MNTNTVYIVSFKYNMSFNVTIPLDPLDMLKDKHHHSRFCEI